MSKEERIYERNPDTGQIKSRKKGDYGNEEIVSDSLDYSKQLNETMDKVIHPVRKRIRAEVLDELWAADKLNKDGYWYIKLSDVIKIIGEE